MVALLTISVGAAPLFPDVPDGHWAKDAVAALAAKGLVEGYPDGTFKGDRAASRWEVAMIVARLLSKMEQAHATFATKAELEEVRKLANALREELDALGVRVTNLEESVGRLDRRVTELERITFYGSFEARMTSQSYSNSGANFSDPQDGIINFNDAVGSVTGAGGRFVGGPADGLNFDPFAFGTFTVNNLKNGRPLSNGTGYTAKATLGMLVKVNEDIDAGVEFAAYTSQGDTLTDLYYGVSAPYLSNAFTANSTITGGLAGTQPANHRPFTRMTLDHFWMYHKPSQTRVRLGAFNDIHFDPGVYQLQYNPGAFGPARLDSYGFLVNGRVGLDEEDSQALQWEVMGTLLPDRNGGVNGAGYFNHAEGGNLTYLFHDELGRVRLNFLHAANDASGGAARQVGLITAANFGPTPWVNPNGFFFNQLGGPNMATAGIGSTGDVRPIPMPALGNDGITGVAGQANFGNIGPQDQVTYGISAAYQWDNDYSPRIEGQYSHSEYRPQKNSSYSADGDAFLIKAGVTPVKDLDLDFEYVSVDATYSPFVLQIPRVGGILNNGFRMGENFLSFRGDLYSLHDTDIFPNNREGFRGKLRWKFADTGVALARFGFLDQRTSSLQDVRFSANALGAGIPNTPVLGFSPGFVDPVFHGFSPFTFVGSGGNALAVPLENPKGDMTFYALAAEHKWYVEDEPEAVTIKDTGYYPDSTYDRQVQRRRRGVKLRANYNSTNYHRNSNLQALRGGSAAGTAGENVNYVDLDYSAFEIQVEYDVTSKFTPRLGYGRYNLSGHYDPYGVYSGYAVSTGLTRFKNLDLEQDRPFVGFAYDISDSMKWDLEASFMSFDDKVSSAVFGAPTIPFTNTQFITQRSLHPFSFDGIQINTAVSVSF